MSSFPPYPSSLQPARQIDQIAQQVCQRIVDGDVDDGDGRWYLAGLLLCSRMPVNVSRTTLQTFWPSAAGLVQVRDDLAAKCVALLEKKICDRSFFDPAQIAQGASFTGWCRMILTSRFGARSELRNLAGSYRSQGSPGPRLLETEADTSKAIGWTAPPSDVQSDDLSFTVALAAYADQAHGAREQQRLQLGARALCRAYDLPRVRTLPTAAAREAVNDDLLRDPQVSYRVVLQLRAGEIACDESPHAQVFARFTIDDLETVAEKDWRFAATLATAAAAAAPPVGHDVASELTKQFVELVQPGTPAAHLARMVARAWLVSSTTMIGDEFSGTWTFKSDEQVADEAAEFTRHTTRLVRTGAMPGMVKVSQVESWLEQRCEELQAGRAATMATARAAHRSGAA